MQARYYKLIDWQSAGLDRETYVDIGDTENINLDAILRQQPIGRLTTADQVAMFEFAKRWQSNN
ncbi:hypothetical protein [Lactiplantibacillus carotarum]|uniref:hypothetical protein n=1 Tax=Lactiplantibacillus carotarum TaxID=2993456 RepID=UPI00298F0F9B|nr:hypothetical protein [Lactiplantibacillus carotarum]